MIRAPSAESAFHGVDALAKGGITGIEITFSTPDAPDIIDLLRQRFGDSVLIGAGSIVQPSQAIEAAQAGASFLVSPGRLRVRCEGHHRNGPHHHPPRADAQQSYGCQRRRRRRHQDLSGKPERPESERQPQRPIPRTRLHANRRRLGRQPRPVARHGSRSSRCGRRIALVVRPSRRQI